MPWQCFSCFSVPIRLFSSCPQPMTEAGLNYPQIKQCFPLIPTASNDSLKMGKICYAFPPLYDRGQRCVQRIIIDHFRWCRHILPLPVTLFCTSSALAAGHLSVVPLAYQNCTIALRRNFFNSMPLLWSKAKLAWNDRINPSFASHNRTLKTGICGISKEGRRGQPKISAVFWLKSPWFQPVLFCFFKLFHMDYDRMGCQRIGHR